MTDKRIAKQHHAAFVSIRQQDAAGNEYWSARKLANVLEYSEYRHFQPVIGRALEACQGSGYAAADHFVVSKTNSGRHCKMPSHHAPT